MDCVRNIDDYLWSNSKKHYYIGKALYYNNKFFCIYGFFCSFWI